MFQQDRLALQEVRGAWKSRAWRLSDGVGEQDTYVRSGVVFQSGGAGRLEEILHLPAPLQPIITCHTLMSSNQLSAVRFKTQYLPLCHAASTSARESHLSNISTSRLHFQTVSFKSDAGTEPRLERLVPRPVAISSGPFNWFSCCRLQSTHEVTPLKEPESGLGLTATWRRFQKCSQTSKQNVVVILIRIVYSTHLRCVSRKKTQNNPDYL